MFIQGLETLPEKSLERLRLVLGQGRYTPVGTTRARRLQARVFASRLTGVARPGSGWSESLEAFWKPWTVELPPLASRTADLEFHARYIASVEGAGGEHGMGVLAPGDLPRLARLALAGNFYDLRIAVLWGVDTLERAPGDPALFTVQAISRMPWSAVHARILSAYVKAVHRMLDKDMEAWMRHTGYSRATIYRWWADHLD